MRKNAKKLFALILALCMSLTLLTACGGDTAGSDSGVGADRIRNLKRLLPSTMN